MGGGGGCVVYVGLGLGSGSGSGFSRVNWVVLPALFAECTVGDVLVCCPCAGVTPGGHQHRLEQERRQRHPVRNSADDHECGGGVGPASACSQHPGPVSHQQGQQHSVRMSVCV
jgi:hypothetical protein